MLDYGYKESKENKEPGRRVIEDLQLGVASWKFKIVSKGKDTENCNTFVIIKTDCFLSIRFVEDPSHYFFSCDCHVVVKEHYQIVVFAPVESRIE